MSTSQELSKDLELFHYGVLGMKWGVRKDRQGKKSNRATKTPKKSKISRVASEFDQRSRSGKIRRNENAVRTLSRGSSSDATLGESAALGNHLSAIEIMRFGSAKKAAKYKISQLNDQTDRLRTGKTSVMELSEVYMQTRLEDLFAKPKSELVKR